MAANNEMITNPVSSCSSAAERMRRHRQRRRQGYRVLPIEIHDQLVDELVRRRYLAPDHRNELPAVQKGFYRLLRALLNGGA